MKEGLKIILILLVILIVIVGSYLFYVQVKLNQAKSIYLSQTECAYSCSEEKAPTETGGEFQFDKLCLQKCADQGYPKINLGQNNPFVKNSQAIKIRDELVECSSENHLGTYNSFEEWRNCFKEILNKYS